MDKAISLWPAFFVGFWAYPFIAIPYFRRRRAAMDIARMVSDEQVETIDQAVRIITTFRLQVLADCHTQVQGHSKVEG